MRMAYEAHKLVADLYHHLLVNTEEGVQALSYLKERGITEETIKTFKLGYSIKNTHTTISFLKHRGYQTTDLLDRKIISVSQKSGRYYDPFFDRIIFPIFNYQNQVVAFAGRSMNQDSKVKYLNSPESKIFKKQDNLFGYHQAKEEIKNQGYAIVFEGYFDVLSAHQYGLKNTVASMGTALTVEQALLLKEITDNVIVVYDGDKAGINASFRSATLLEQVGCKVLVGSLPNGDDPDTWFQKYKNRQKFIDEIINKGINRKKFYIQYKIKKIDINNSSERFSLLNELMEEVPINDLKERLNWLNYINQYLNAPSKKIGELLK